MASTAPWISRNPLKRQFSELSRLEQKIYMHCVVRELEPSTFQRPENPCASSDNGDMNSGHFRPDPVCGQYWNAQTFSERQAGPITQR